MSNGSEKFDGNIRPRIVPESSRDFGGRDHRNQDIPVFYKAAGPTEADRAETKGVVMDTLGLLGTVLLAGAAFFCVSKLTQEPREAISESQPVRKENVIPGEHSAKEELPVEELEDSQHLASSSLSPSVENLAPKSTSKSDAPDLDKQESLILN